MLFTVGTATVALTSTLDGRQTTCPGEMVTYTCTVLRTAVISWVVSPGIMNRVDYYPRDQIGPRVVGDFQIALTSNVRNGTGLADLTTTLTVTATLARNGTVVQCRGDDPSERMSLVLNIASEQSMPSIIIIANTRVACCKKCLAFFLYVCLSSFDVITD